MERNYTKFTDEEAAFWLHIDHPETSIGDIADALGFSQSDCKRHISAHDRKLSNIDWRHGAWTMWQGDSSWTWTRLARALNRPESTTRYGIKAYARNNRLPVRPIR